MKLESLHYVPPTAEDCSAASELLQVPRMTYQMSECELALVIWLTGTIRLLSNLNVTGPTTVGNVPCFFSSNSTPFACRYIELYLLHILWSVVSWVVCGNILPTVAIVTFVGNVVTFLISTHATSKCIPTMNHYNNTALWTTKTQQKMFTEQRTTCSRQSPHIHMMHI